MECLKIILCDYRYRDHHINNVENGSADLKKKIVAKKRAKPQ